MRQRRHAQAGKDQHGDAGGRAAAGQQRVRGVTQPEALEFHSEHVEREDCAHDHGEPHDASRHLIAAARHEAGGTLRIGRRRMGVNDFGFGRRIGGRHHSGNAAGS